MVWASPCSALGLLLGVAVLGLGGRVHRLGHTLEFCVHPGALPARSRLGALPFVAVTLGQVIVGISGDSLAALRTHEHVHVAQFEAWGPLFLLADPAASLWAWLQGRGAYRGNRFEQQAFQATASARPAPSIHPTARGGPAAP